MLGFKHRQSGGVNPWTYVGASTAFITAASGNFTATLPAGTQAGDLLVASIVTRDAQAVNAPAGWTRIAQSTTGNGISDATTSIASGHMSFIVRGAGAPSVAFTRSGGGHLICRIVAYRGGLSATPSDASTSLTATEISSSRPGSLIVMAAALARPTSASAFNAAGLGTAASGTGGQTAPPSVSEFLERFESSAPVGGGFENGCALAVADAVIKRPRATGTLQATAGSSARHVLIAGIFAPFD